MVVGRLKKVTAFLFVLILVYSSMTQLFGRVIAYKRSFAFHFLSKLVGIEINLSVSL